MEHAGIDLRKEQQASLERPRYPYSLVARSFFLSMDLFTGRRTTLGKAKLIEMLAGVPYRASENRQYVKMTRHYRDEGLVHDARALVGWAREARATSTGVCSSSPRRCARTALATRGT